jgi:hypothetical protein
MPGAVRALSPGGRIRTRGCLICASPMVIALSLHVLLRVLVHVLLRASLL